ncbi:hypothetical protein EYF80_001480 [Liparis tanakae]|uniref:Uncharacterized protein n=1 Tax=Liparis tanakae TaxID=230148 RepID=A0A4Z2JEK9_9TELE|nr:hypothetical protein EYF80_001480 [Liparis tanakae]
MSRTAGYRFTTTEWFRSTQVLYSDLFKEPGATVSTQASAEEARAGQPQRKRPRDREALLEFMKEQAERDREEMGRGTEKERDREGEGQRGTRRGMRRGIRWKVWR